MLTKALLNARGSATCVHLCSAPGLPFAAAAALLAVQRTVLSLRILGAWPVQ